jgi:hypothetical protein
MKSEATYGQHKRVISLMIVAIIFVLAGVLGSGSPATADADVTFVLPDGTACAGFDLQVEIWGGNQVFKQFEDKNGNIVRYLSAGKGSRLLFTNLDTDATFLVKPNGSVTHITVNIDESQTWSTTGHNVLILYPTDVPAGPSTTAYVGRVVYTVGTDGVFTLQEVSGRATDICAALSQ